MLVAGGVEEGECFCHGNVALVAGVLFVGEVGGDVLVEVGAFLGEAVEFCLGFFFGGDGEGVARGFAGGALFFLFLACVCDEAVLVFCVGEVEGCGFAVVGCGGALDIGGGCGALFFGAGHVVRGGANYDLRFTIYDLLCTLLDEGVEVAEL